MDDEDNLFTIRCFPDSGHGCDWDVRGLVVGVRENVDDATILGDEDGIWSRYACICMRVKLASIA
jgi:hypothetical protein